MSERKVEINAADRKIIEKLQELLGEKLEPIPKIKLDSRGYAVNEAGAVVGLGMFGFAHPQMIDDNRLQELALALGSLTSLTQLNLILHQITDLVPLAVLTNLTQLNLSGNKLTDLAPLSALTSITQLSLSYNKIRDLSPLAGTMRLTQLNAGNNQITDLAPLAALTRLTQLDLSDNQLTDLAPLTGLTRLTELTLGSNKLTDLAPLAGLTSLTQLDVRGNRLTDISALAGLTNLTKLYLIGNQLTDLSALSDLKNLTNLDASENELTDLSTLALLTKLKALELSYNNLLDLFPLASLKNLTQLHVRGNLITDLSPLADLTSLTLLDVHNNQLTTIPPELFERDWQIHWDDGYGRDGFNLYGNPLESPPVEIVKKGREAVQNYFKSLKELKPEEVVRLYEAKLLVVGPGDVGKTFLSNRLIYGKTPPTESTEGIDIHKWVVDTKGIKGFRINLWDFGGQEIYHATHQFFLTKRSLYLFVWEARRDDDRVSFGYWLNVIKLLSDSAPVIMVMNKCDERRKPIDQAAIQKQFPNVIGFYEVSAEKDIGIDTLRGRVIEEIEKLEQIGTTLPKQWVDIRGQLEGMKEEGQNYITYQEYQDICTGHKLNEKQAGHLAGYYHELGIILHFADNPVLKDIVFLNPEWATDAVYAVTDYKPIKENYGRFHFGTLKGIWKEYPADKYAALLELMMKFEICFNLEETKEYIIPELLRPERRSFEWSYQDNLHFQYKYDFMPAGIITRFMVRNHHLIKDDLYWKNGVVMKWEGTGTLIEGNEFEGKIDIWIRGEDTKGMLGITRSDIEHIHETLNRPVAAERMPCICSECKSGTEPHFYNYHDLRTLLRKNARSVQCRKSAEEISIDGLLGEYGISEEDRELNAKNGGDTYNIGGDFIRGTQTKTGDMEGEMVAIGDGKISQTTTYVSPSGGHKKLFSSTIWRISGSFIAVFLVALAVLYAPEWKVKAALIAGAAAASLSIIFNPKTWHRRAALCLLMLVGAAQIGFGLYGNYHPSQEEGVGGYLVLSGPAIIVQVLIIIAAVIIYVTGEIFSKRNE